MFIYPHVVIQEYKTYTILYILQKLQDLLEEGKPLMAQVNDYGQQVAGYTPDESLTDAISKQSKQFNSVADQVKRVADKVNLQRHKSMEVGEQLLNHITNVLSSLEMSYCKE